MKRLVFIDVLKAIAIVAVVLYHFGYAPAGYLGVDLFLVINGYLLSKKFGELKTVMGGVNFLLHRVLRLSPVLLVGTAVCLIWGSYWMLPYAYQDLSQYVIASNLYANNFLMRIKAWDYWSISNEFKPLMHTWYLGIVVQFYLFFTVSLIIVRKLFKSKRSYLWLTAIVFVCSLVLYFLPGVGFAQRFYFLPFRLFEFCAGILIAQLLSWLKEKTIEINKPLGSVVFVLSFVCLLFLMFVNVEFVSGLIKLPIVVLLSSIVLLAYPYINIKIDFVVSNKWLAKVGEISFSLYIWHQIVFGFYRYSFSSSRSIGTFVLLISITIILSLLSYYFIEKRVNQYIKRENGVKRLTFAVVTATLVITGVAFYINSISGVVRDVPELDTYKGKTTDRMHIAYNEAPYKMNKNFSTDDKLHVLVIGNSFGRDWFNILKEMNLDDQVELSYLVDSYKNYDKYKDRIADADLIFRTMGPNHENNQSTIDDAMYIVDTYGFPKERMIVVGSKMFGYCCGQIYSHRKSPDYYSLSLDIPRKMYEDNNRFQEELGDRFIDMITPVIVSGNSVRVFTDNHKIISQDCIHLTQNGAKMYAEIFKERIEKEIIRQKSGDL